MMRRNNNNNQFTNIKNERGGLITDSIGIKRIRDYHGLL